MSIKISAADIGEQFVTRGWEVVKLYGFYHDHYYPCKFKTLDGRVLTTQTDGYSQDCFTEADRDVVDRFVVQATAQLAVGTVEPEEDEVNHPSHYKQGAIECIEAIRAALTPEEFRGYCKGNMLKYVWREKHKQQDVAIEKAVWYANTMLGKAND